jgi:pyridoxine 4-dehydrogenase
VSGVGHCRCHGLEPDLAQACPAHGGRGQLGSASRKLVVGITGSADFLWDPHPARKLLGMTKTSLLGDKPVNRIGFGAMQLAGPGVFGPPRDPEAARGVLRRALELGVDHIDTSQFYGPNVVNELIREALYPYPDQLRLVTKVGGRRDDKGAWLPAQTPSELRSGVEDNLRTLRIERLDAVNLRLMDGGEDLLAEQLGELEDMRSEGKLDLIGISNADTDTVRRALELVDIACVQNSYSVVNRADAEELALCEEHDIAFVPFFPLGSAFSGGPQQLAADPAVAEVADQHGATPSQVALAWLLHRSERILLIPGTSSVSHLQENMAAGEIELDDQDMSRLDEAKQLGDPLAAVQH